MLLILVYKSDTITVEWSETENVYFLRLNSNGEIEDRAIFQGIPKIAEEFKKRPGNVLILPSEMALTNVETIKRYVSATRGSKVKEAVVVRNLAQRILANFMIRFINQEHPVKCFSAETEALAWLKG